MSDYDKVLEAQRRLEEKFPKMFVDLYGGLDIGPGWVTLIETLCERIQSHIDWKKSEDTSQVVVEQIKEKFGTLRFYYSGGDDYISGLVSMAEAMSGYICETCGSPGKVRGDGWIKCACETHK